MSKQFGTTSGVRMSMASDDSAIFNAPSNHDESEAGFSVATNDPAIEMLVNQSCQRSGIAKPPSTSTPMGPVHHNYQY